MSRMSDDHRVGMVAVVLLGLTLLGIVAGITAYNIKTKPDDCLDMCGQGAVKTASIVDAKISCECR